MAEADIVTAKTKFASTPIYATKKMWILRKAIGQILKYRLQDLVEHLLSCDMPVDTSVSALTIKLQRIVSFSVINNLWFKNNLLIFC